MSKAHSLSLAECLSPAFDAHGRLIRMSPAVIVPLTGTTAQMIIDEAIAAEAGGADILEWRIDFMIGAHKQLSLAPLGREVIRPILEATSIPLLLTIRTAGEGGQAKLSLGRYRLLLAELLDTLVHIDVSPERIGLDLEQWFEGTAALTQRAQKLGFLVVISAHDWQETPHQDVMQLMYEEMLELPHVVAKLSVLAHSDQDAQRLLHVVKKVARSTGRSLIAVAMGAEGRLSRIEGWRYGSVATFATVGHASNIGQPTISELREALGT